MTNFNKKEIKQISDLLENLEKIGNNEKQLNDFKTFLSKILKELSINTCIINIVKTRSTHVVISNDEIFNDKPDSCFLIFAIFKENKKKLNLIENILKNMNITILYKKDIINNTFKIKYKPSNSQKNKFIGNLVKFNRYVKNTKEIVDISEVQVFDGLRKKGFDIEKGYFAVVKSKNIDIIAYKITNEDWNDVSEILKDDEIQQDETFEVSLGKQPITEAKPILIKNNDKKLIQKRGKKKSIRFLIFKNKKNLESFQKTTKNEMKQQKNSIQNTIKKYFNMISNIVKRNEKEINQNKEEINKNKNKINSIKQIIDNNKNEINKNKENISNINNQINVKYEILLNKINEIDQIMNSNLVINEAQVLHVQQVY